MNLHDFDKMREGARLNALENARNLLNMKLGTPAQIAQATNLSLEQVLALQNQTAASPSG